MRKVYTVQELQKILTPIFQQNGVKQAILFGSYAKGLATAKSDIDLLVDSGLRGLAFFGLLEDVATAVDALIDPLDVSQIEKTPGSTGRFERAGWRFMDSRDRRVFQKLQAHTEAILRYCQDCQTLADFESDSMRVEATVFGVGSITKILQSRKALRDFLLLPLRPCTVSYGKSGLFCDKICRFPAAGPSSTCCVPAVCCHLQRQWGFISMINPAQLTPFASTVLDLYPFIENVELS